MLTKDSAMSLVFDKWLPKPAVETLAMEDALGRVLANDIHARYTLPVVRAAGMDSVALISARFQSGMPETEAFRRGVDYERADMGDDFDDRFDCTVPVESVTFLEDGGIRLREGTEVRNGAGIRLRGSTVRENELLLKKGTHLVATDLAVMAIGGVTHCEVLKRPVVAYIPTGSELVQRGMKPDRGQNLEANGIFLECALREMGAFPVVYPIVRDDREELARILGEALKTADIVILNGGTSKGSEDLTIQLLEEGGELLFHGIAAAPGRPLGISVIQGKPVVNLPGPPPAAFAVSDWCLGALVSRYLGIARSKRHTVRAVLTDTLETPAQMEFTARLNVSKSSDGTFLAEPLHMGRASLVHTVGANGVFVSPIGMSRLEKGTEIDVELLRASEYIS